LVAFCARRATGSAALAAVIGGGVALITPLSGGHYGGGGSVGNGNAYAIAAGAYWGDALVQDSSSRRS